MRSKADSLIIEPREDCQCDTEDHTKERSPSKAAAVLEEKYRIDPDQAENRTATRAIMLLTRCPIPKCRKQDVTRRQYCPS